MIILVILEHINLLIRDLCKNKKFFKNEEFNIAAKIITLFNK
jgi:hypothetical protein